MKQTLTQNLRLGIFTILGAVVFIAIIYFIGNKQSMFGDTVPLYAHFNNVNGLQPGNNVRYSGIGIGTVRNIEMINDTTIVIQMEIDNKIMCHIRKNAVATISSDGLVGSMIVNIIPGSHNRPIVAAGDTIASYSRIRTDDILKTLNVTNENAALLTADLLKISNQILQGKGSIGILLKDTVMGSNLKETVRYLKLTSMQTASAVKKLDDMLVSLNRKDNVVGVLNDTAVAGKIRNIVINLDKSAADMHQSIKNLDGIISDTKNGKGAFNYLTKNPDSAVKIDSILQHVDQASLLLQQDLEALKHNIFLRGYFRKQAKTAKQPKVK